MRLKPFLLLLLIFTILYILFFRFYDVVSHKRSIKKEKEKALKKISLEGFTSFALFYGIQSTCSVETIILIYTDFMVSKTNKKISEEAKKYAISNIEYIIIILYLEYLTLIPKKIFPAGKDIVMDPNLNDQNLVDKYSLYFNNKYSLQDIVKAFGSNVLNDLYYLDSVFLVPGVRYQNNTIYYVGDGYEKK